MDINQPRPKGYYSDQIKKLIKVFTIGTNKPELKGSASLASQQYAGDYDFFSLIPTLTYKDIAEVVKRIKDDPTLYFIELKIQGKKKTRFYPSDPISEEKVTKALSNAEFVKIDAVSFDSRFTEVSCIYSLVADKQSKEEYIESLEQDITDLTKEKAYFKILKRQFTIAKAKGDKSRQVALSKIVTSDLGKEYQLLSQAQALFLVEKYYSDKDTKKKIAFVKKETNLDKSEVDRRFNELNKQAKEFIGPSVQGGGFPEFLAFLEDHL